MQYTVDPHPHTPIPSRSTRTRGRPIKCGEIDKIHAGKTAFVKLTTVSSLEYNPPRFPLLSEPINPLKTDLIGQSKPVAIEFRMGAAGNCS